MSNINYSYSPSFKRVEPEDFNITPFTVNKLWEFNNTDYSSSYGIQTYEAIYPNGNNYPGGVIPYGHSQKYTSQLSNGFDNKLLWYSIKSNFYNDNIRQYYPDLNLKLSLHSTCSLMNIPTNIISEKIKPGTFSLTANSITITDDTNGNLLDSAYTTSDYVDSDYLVGYWGFNEQYDTKKLILDEKGNHGIASNVTFTPGIETTGTVESSGYKANFNNSYIKIENNNTIDFKSNEDFALSFWVDLPISQSATESVDYNSIISKRASGTTLNFDNVEKRMVNTEKTINVSGWAYDISVYNQETSNSGKLRFSRKGGVSELIMTSSLQITGSQHHVVFQKSGSNIEVYIDGALDSSTTDTVDGNTSNKADLYFGANGKTSNYLSGSLDEVRIYNKGLTTAEIGNLASNDYTSGSAYQTSQIGNIFYTSGQIVITDPRPKYKNIFDSTFSGTFKNKHEIYEHEILCKLKESDFNMTLNPTARVGNSEDSQETKGFVTGSWTPYITTIGLYNDRYELLAVAKLAKPIQKRNDVPMNFIVRYDV